MTALRDFEIRAIEILCESALDAQQLAAVCSVEHPARYEYTGSGYFLTVAHSLLPATRNTLSDPAVVGTSGEIVCGFVVFLREHELTLECHTWGAVDVPSDFRDHEVSITTPEVNVVYLG